MVPCASIGMGMGAFTPGRKAARRRLTKSWSRDDSSTRPPASAAGSHSRAEYDGSAVATEVTFTARYDSDSSAAVTLRKATVKFLKEASRGVTPRSVIVPAKLVMVCTVGAMLDGRAVTAVGARLGDADGAVVGGLVSPRTLGRSVGSTVGDAVAIILDGKLDGWLVGHGIGRLVGFCVG